MTQNNKKEDHNNKLHQDFLAEKARKLHKDWMDLGRSGDEKYFGYLNKNSMSLMLIATLFFVILGDVILINNYIHR